jgi:hypothetical protein
MYKLEHDVEDKKKESATIPIIEQLQEQSLEYWKDDYSSSQLVRKKFREEKKARLAEEKKDAIVIEKMGLAIPLVKEQAVDIHLAKLMPFASRDGKKQR